MAYATWRVKEISTNYSLLHFCLLLLYRYVALVSLLIYKSFRYMDIPWLTKMIPVLMNHNKYPPTFSNFTKNVTDDTTEADEQLLPEYLQFCKCYGMKDWLAYAAYGAISSFLMYHVVCGYLQWEYYYKQRDQPQKWKCQPNKFLTPSNERHEILVGTMNILIAGSISGTTSCWMVMVTIQQCTSVWMSMAMCISFCPYQPYSYILRHLLTTITVLHTFHFCTSTFTSITTDITVQQHTQLSPWAPLR